ncbi:MAG TPA: choice-of-anchor V domain-containing protein [Candidatus Solibacter sp.]|nr:choice-of-anchor V domain-containing protein [Candidatus Solibacter sp.]
MQRKRKLLIAKMATVTAAIPFLIWAHEYGPDPGYCGVPKEQGTCTASQCHVGTTNDAKNTGSVSIAFPNGQNYVPGVKQHLVVTIADPASTQRAWGFQLTARLASNTATVAGTFASTDTNTFLMCAGANLFTQLEVDYSPTKTQTCPTNMPLQYVEHSLAGYNASKGRTGSQTYELDWTPPATAQGNVTFYVAGNAANGDLSTNGDHIYATSYTLTPGSAANPTLDNLLSASAFGGYTSVAPGSWMELYGSGLAPTTRQWAGSDFNGTKAPIALDNVKVTIGGQSAFVYYISPTQINAQVPSNVSTGSQQVTITNGSQTSSAKSVTVNALQPGFLAPSSFSIGGKQYVVAQLPTFDNNFVLPPGAIPGLTTRQAKPGETIVIYGVGFGPVKDTGGNDIPAGTVVTAANTLAKSFKMTIGGQNATLIYAGLAPNFVGLYQFNVTVPNIANNDLAPVAFTLDGTDGPQTLFLAVKQ